MSAKGNRRAKGDRGPAKSSQSLNLASSMVSMGDIDMSLLSGINVDVLPSSGVSADSSQCAVYFGNNKEYRNLLKYLSKESYVTRQKVIVPFLF